MSGSIRVTREDLDGYANKYNQESQNMEQMIRNMYGYVDQLEATWEGQAAQAFRERLDSLKPSFENIQQVIGEISTALNKSAQTFSDVDEQLKQAWMN